MSRYDEPTQRVRRAEPPAAPLPGSLDPLRGQRTETGTGWADSAETEVAETGAAETGVLPLDEIFDSPAQPAVPAVDHVSTATTEAPTWTAMPVVPVRSESVRAPEPLGAAEPEPDEPRVDARVRFEAWLRRDDNGLMLLTAVVACVLMLVVAGVGG